MIYDPEFQLRLTTLKGKRKVIISILKKLNNLNKKNYNILIKNLENENLKKKLKNIDIMHFSLYTSNLLFGKGKLKERLYKFKEIGISPNEIAEILFWANPKKFPFPNISKKYDNDYFNIQTKKLKKHNASDFLELYAIESIKKNNLTDDIISEINTITFHNINKKLWLKDLIKELDPITKKRIKDKIIIHPYLERALFSTPKCPVILDGNNIAYWSIPPSIENIYDTLERLSTLKEFYYPFYIVFDKNAKYIFKEDEIFNFPNVYFHSPADELIISLAKSKKAKIISKDQFRDWGNNIKKIILEI